MIHLKEDINRNNLIFALVNLLIYHIIKYILLITG